MIALEEIRKVQLFKGAKDEVLERISTLVDLKRLRANETIFQRGDPGYSMFIIVSGGVSVTLTNAEGVEYSIATLKDGDIFGEMALLTGEPRSANVKTVSDVTVIEVRQKEFDELIEIFPDVNARLMRLLASRLGMTILQRQEEHLEAKDMLANLLGHQQPPEVDRIPGTMKSTIKLNETLKKLADGTKNVCIWGERGTGKELAGKLIHCWQDGSARPLFVLDCADTPPVLREAANAAESDDLMTEAAQEAALFGHEAGSAVYAKGTRRGFLELADGGTLIIKNVEFMMPKAQAGLVSFLRTGAFSRIGEEEKLRSKVRVISTATSDIRELAAQGNFNPGLYALLTQETVKLPALRERKKDVPDLALNYLKIFNQKAHKNITGFSKGAMNALVDYGWPSNSIELRQVIDRAVALCKGDEILAEHIFLDITPFTSAGKLNLLKNELVDKMVRHRLFPAGIQYFTVPFFLALILLTLLGPVKDNPMNIVAWGVLWPLLILTVAFSARSWCGYCPMNAISSSMVFRRKKFIAVPDVIKKYGIWFGIFGFVFIIWIEHATRMADRAPATAVLFMSILGGAMVTTLLFGRRVWCLHLCPLGRAIGQFSTISMLELRSNSNVCLSQCQTHDCINENGCPMGLHPSSEKTKHDCVLCMACVKSCRHKSVHLDLLLPKQKILSMGKWEFPRAFFAVLLLASVIAIKIPAWVFSHGVSAGAVPVLLNPHSMPGELIIYLAMIAGFTAAVFLASSSANRDAWRRNFIHAGYAYLPMAFFGLFSVYFREFVERGHQILPLTVNLVGLSGAIRSEWVTPNLGTLKGLFPVITLAGAAFSFYLLKEIKEKYSLPPAAYRLNQIVMAAVTVVFLIML